MTAKNAKSKRDKEELPTWEALVRKVVQEAAQASGKEKIKITCVPSDKAEGFECNIESLKGNARLRIVSMDENKELLKGAAMIFVPSKVKLDQIKPGVFLVDPNWVEKKPGVFTLNTGKVSTPGTSFAIPAGVQPPNRR